jgi:hypothetical protein
MARILRRPNGDRDVATLAGEGNAGMVVHVVAVKSLPDQALYGLAVPQVLVGLLGLVVALTVARRQGRIVVVLFSLGAASFLISELLYVAFFLVWHDLLDNINTPVADLRRWFSLINPANATTVVLEEAGLALMFLAVAARRAGHRDPALIGKAKASRSRHWATAATTLVAVSLAGATTWAGIVWYQSAQMSAIRLEMPRLLIAAIGTALVLALARRVGLSAAVLAGVGGVLWGLRSLALIWNTSQYPALAAQRAAWERAIRDHDMTRARAAIEQLDHLQAIMNEVIVIAIVLAAIGFGLLVVAVVARRIDGLMPLPAGEVSERGQLRLLTTGAVLGLGMVIMGVVVGWVVAPGELRPPTSDAPRLLTPTPSGVWAITLVGRDGLR